MSNIVTESSSGLSTFKRIEFEGIGLEDFENDKVEIGFLKCIQKSSQESEIEGVSPGDFFNTVTGESYGPSVDIIVVKKDVQWVKFPDDNAVDEKTLWSDNGQNWSNGSRFTEEEKWKCMQYRFYILIKNAIDPIPVRLILKSTSRKTGSRLSNMIKRFILVNKEPLFKRSYKVTSEKKTDKMNSFYIVNESINDGFNSIEEQGLAFDARKVAQAHVLGFSSGSEGGELVDAMDVIDDKPDDLGLDS